jgi:hypothetical protein
MNGMRREDGAWTAPVSEDWQQGRTLFGGLSGALCLEAVIREFNDLPPLRSAQFSLTGPAVGTIAIRPTLLRRGKSTAFVCADLSGDSGLAMRATFCFTSPRNSVYSHETVPAPSVKPPDQCPSFARQVNFAQHFDNRLADGNRPFSEADDPTMVLWMRLREDSSPHIADCTRCACRFAAPCRASFVQAADTNQHDDMGIRFAD